MAHPLSASLLCGGPPRSRGVFCVVVPGFTGLTKLSHESPAGQHWAALAASQSRGTPLGQANNQPTNSPVEVVKQPGARQ